jgi:hypothetical protein
MYAKEYKYERYSVITVEPIVFELYMSTVRFQRHRSEESSLCHCFYFI